MKIPLLLLVSNYNHNTLNKINGDLIVTSILLALDEEKWKTCFHIPKKVLQTLLPIFDNHCHRNQILSSTQWILMILFYLSTGLYDQYIAILFNVERRTWTNLRKKGISLLFDNLKHEISPMSIEWRLQHSVTINSFQFSVIIDGSEQKSVKPWNAFDDIAYYSAKKGQHSITTIVGYSPRGRKILFITNSYPGSVNDNILLLKEQKHLQFLSKKEYVLADAGFQKLDHLQIWTPPNHSCPLRKNAQRYRILIEQLFGMMKKWLIIAHPLPLKTNQSEILEYHHQLWTILGAFVNLYNLGPAANEE